MGVSSIPFDDRRLFSTFSGLVVSARFAHVGLANADCTSWRPNLSSFAPKRRLELRVEATATVGITSTVPTSRGADLTCRGYCPLSLAFRRLRAVGL